MNKFFKNFLTLVSILFNKLLKRPDFSEKKIFLQGKILENQNLKKEKINDLGEIEFSVFSQFGEDGIISWLSNQIPDIKKIFLEIGTQDYWESNTRYLLKSQQWKGYIIEGSKEYFQKIKKQSIYWQNNLTAINEFITKENVNEIIKNSVKETNLGLFSLDIDGNDYWIWEKINKIDPVIVIVEFNSNFGFKEKITIPYNEKFERSKSHYSNLYWGSSLEALKYLGQKKNYKFVCTNSSGNNAYFIKSSRFDDLKLNLDKNIYGSKFRESRDKNGKKNFLSGNEKIDEIMECKVICVESQKEAKLKDFIK